MKTIYSYLCRHDGFSLGFITALMVLSWLCYFAPPEIEVSQVVFVSAFGLLTAVWALLFVGSILSWSSSK